MGKETGSRQNGRKVIRCQMRFVSYIAHPYWPEREQVIRLQLHSGMNRMKSDSTKLAALKAQCEKDGITLPDYELLLVRAARQWYRTDNENQTSPIVIPRHQLAGCLVETVGRSPKTLRGKYEKDSFRHHVQISDFVTDRTELDGVYSRFVKLDGSNKRDLQENEYIEDFLATGTFSVSTDTKPKDLRRLVAHAFSEIGTGASRKMGYGRGKIVEFEEA